MSAASKPLGAFAIGSLTLLFLVVVMTPWEPFHWTLPNIVNLSVDAAFVIAQPVLFESGAQYGPDVVFTYGPWGMLITGVAPPELYFTILILRLFFAVAVALAGLTALAGSEAQSKTRWLLVLSFWGLILYWMAGIDQGFWYFPSLFVALYHTKRDEVGENRFEYAVAAIATAASAWIGFVKFNFFVLGFAVQAIVLAFAISRRRWPVLFGLWAVTTIVAWLAAGQHLINLPTWIAACLDLASGYSDAMSKGFFKPYSRSIVAIYVVGTASFLAAAWIIARRASTLRLRSLQIGVALTVTFLSWQHTIGGNQIEQAFGEVCSCLWLLLVIAPVASERTALLSPALLGGITVGLGVTAIAATTFFDYPASLGHNFQAKWEGFVSIAHADVANFRDSWSELMASTRKGIPVTTDLTGTADVYPQQTAAVIAQPQFRYTPRPAYLSLNAHTTKLAERNAEFLRKHAPDVVLFQMLPPNLAINKRHPATADGPSWPELISRYDVDGTTPDFLVLKKRAEPIAYSFENRSYEEIAWGEPVPIADATRLIWAKIHIRPSLIGRLVKTIYKAPHVSIEETLADGTILESQLVPPLAEAGFLLSPSVTDSTGFARLMQNSVASRTDSAKAVKSIRLITEGNTAWFWNKAIHIELADLTMNDEGLRTVPASVSRVLVLREAVEHADPCLFPPAATTAPDVSGPVYLFHAPCSTWISVPRGAIGVRLSYGLRYIPNSKPPATDGAGMQIDALGPTGSSVATGYRYLDPARVSEDRGSQTLTLFWAAGAATDVQIAFDSGQYRSAIYDHTYIEDVEFLTGDPEKTVAQPR